MGTKESKFEESLFLEDLPKFFHDFAMRMEKSFGEKGKSTKENLADFSKIRLRIKRDGKRAGIKLKVKWDSFDNEEPSDSTSTNAGKGKVSYKKLKKRMDKTFKSFSRDLQSGMIPAAEALESFQRDTDLMVTYKDKGAPFYEEFKKACSIFLNACWKDNVSIAQASYEWLKKLKTACHDQFK